MKPLTLLASAFLLAVPSFLHGSSDIGFIERFSLAQDRAEALKHLIPGTEDYYYYHCLHYQNTGEFDKMRAMITPWEKQFGQTNRLTEIIYRQAIIEYGNDPKKSLEYIKRELGLHFDHQKESAIQPNTYPSKLDDGLVAWENLSRDHLRSDENTIGRFTPAAYDRLMNMKLNEHQRRTLLSALPRPDHPKTVDLVVADLGSRDSGGFGSLPIHRELLLSQLDQLLKRLPALKTNSAFVYAYIAKLRPSPESDWRNDPKLSADYLDRMWAFASTLDPVFNTLKLHILYHRLLLDQSQGTLDKERFMTYIQFPREREYMRPEYLTACDYRHHADPQYNVSPVTGLPAVGDDEPLLRDILYALFEKEESIEPYAKYLRDTFLKECLAEAKVLRGIGDQNRWFALLSPEQAKNLKDRVEIHFAPINKRRFGPTESVVLDVDIKNGGKLIVRHYLLNMENYYRQFQREIDLGVNLDGLVANDQKTVAGEENPFLRLRRRFEFPELKGRGAYVIELIGNGVRSRALVLKGDIRFIEKPTAAGHLFTLLDEAGKVIKDGAILMEGRECRADGEGRVAIPYSTNPKQQQIILRAGDFCSLGSFNHLAESYRLSAGIHVDREALLKDRSANVLIRPVLTCNDERAPIKLLEHATLVIRSQNREGIVSTHEVGDLKLSELEECVVPFDVPENLAHISFTLKGSVKNISRNEDEELSSSRSYALNRIDKTQQIDDLHLSLIDNEYVLEVLGKNGEPRPSTVLHVAFHHHFVDDAINVTLQTDKDGRINLGRLDEVDEITANHGGEARTWNMVADRAQIARVIHGAAGKEIAIPYAGRRKTIVQEGFSLLERRADSYAHDRIEALSLKDGALVVAGLEPGDYDLMLKESEEQITLRIGSGEESEGHVVGDLRMLERSENVPMTVKSIETTNDDIKIILANATGATRIHVVATRFLPGHSLFDDLALPLRDPDMVVNDPTLSAYISGVKVGDEESYILARQYAHKFPGNMLERPSLLLNPMALKESDTGSIAVGAGQRYGGRQGGKREAVARGGGAENTVAGLGRFSNLDFLAKPSVLMANLHPDAKGIIAIARKDLGECRHVHILVVDRGGAIVRHLSLPGQPRTLRDLRLNLALDPKKLFVQERKISALKKGEQFRLGDITASRFEAYDELSRIYALYVTLSNDPKLVEFQFITHWDKMSREERLEKYAKYASHELNFFLYKKDRVFFDEVVQPYIKNKKDKTFLDHWLLADDLSGYLDPWAFDRLNVVEQILLCQRIPVEQDGIKRDVRERNDLIPLDRGAIDRIFETAVARSALAGKDGLGFEGEKRKQVAELEKKQQLLKVQIERKDRAEAEELPVAPKAPPPRLQEKLNKLESDEKRENESKIEELAKKSDEEDKMMETRRRTVDRLYRKLDKTRAWVENNYFNLTVAEQGAGLVGPNPFWVDYAIHGGGEGFFSPNFALASRNFTEMLFALALLDVPFSAGKHKVTYRESTMELEPATPLLAVYQEIGPTGKRAEKSPIMVSQNLFLDGERFRREGNEEVDNFIGDEFLVHKVYGCHVVVTNAGSTAQKVTALLQIPRGAIPVREGFYTKGINWDLAPYTTQTIEFFFYFPKAGEETLFPVNVAREGTILAAAEPMTLKVLDKPSKVDTRSWDHISQEGSNKDVLDYLDKHNAHQIDLDRIAFRLRDRGFFNDLLRVLRQRHIYHDLTWSYALYHNDPAALGEYLKHSSFLARCGTYLDTPLVKIDPVERNLYQHIEFSPLVNARAHQIGNVRTISTSGLDVQYREFLTTLSYKPALDEMDKVVATYYFLLQDRIEEALAFFDRIDASKLPTRIQYDYLTAYVALYREDPRKARETAEKYREHPVLRWRNKFLAVLSQTDEIGGKKGAVADDKNREQGQEQLAANQPTLDLSLEGRKATVAYRNVAKARVNYYLMDTELLFSLNPFQREQAGRFGVIRPNGSAELDLPAGERSVVFDLPPQFHNSNVLVEVSAGGVTRSQAYYANTMNVEMMELYGQIRVVEGASKQQLSKAYVKVYALRNDGGVEFYKDGYTDLRGRFDYASCSTDKLDYVAKFAILVADPSHGALVKEAAPPKR